MGTGAPASRLAARSRTDCKLRHSGHAVGMPPKRNSGLSEAPPHYHGHRDRLRARFREAGSEALADYEMLELILFRAIPQRDVKPLAKQLLEKFGSFAEVISAPAARLKEIGGLGDAAVTEFKI